MPFPTRCLPITSRILPSAFSFPVGHFANAICYSSNATCYSTAARKNEQGRPIATDAHYLLPQCRNPTFGTGRRQDGRFPPSGFRLEAPSNTFLCPSTPQSPKDGQTFFTTLFAEMGRCHNPILLSYSCGTTHGYALLRHYS